MQLKHVVLYAVDDDRRDLELLVTKAEFDLLTDAQMWPRSEWAQRYNIHSRNEADRWAAINRFVRIDIIYRVGFDDNMRTFYTKPLTHLEIAKQVQGRLEEVCYG